MPPVGTLPGRVAATNAAGTLQYLVTLDDLWTAELESRSGQGSLDAEEIEALSALGNSMRERLEFVPGQMRDLSEMVEEVDDATVEDALSEIVRIAAETEVALNLSEAIEGLRQDFRAVVVDACNYLIENSGAEANTVAEKTAAIREAGEVPPGDLKFPFKCAAFLALVGAGVTAAIGFGGAPILVGLGVANQVGLGAFGWRAADCPTALPRIRRARVT
ncbi:MAG TPA: hypothetical protein VGH14_04425 [Solirubrobacterales bacterium]|jgi:hypothetical protein